MKKLLTLVLAVAMVLSMASVALAANTQIGTVAHQGDITTADVMLKYDEDGGDSPFVQVTDPAKTVPYGETLYIPLAYTSSKATTGESDNTYGFVTSADAVSGLKLSAKWDANGKYVDSVEIVKKEGWYWIAIKTTGTSMSDNDVEGTITVKGKAYDYEDMNDKDAKKSKIDSFDVDVIVTLGYATAGKDGAGVEIEEEAKIFKFEEKYGLSDEEMELEVEGEDVTFTVDTTHQSKLVLSCTTDAIEEVEDAYPAANLDFYVFNGATFKKTGELFIPADEGTYLYEVVDNKVVAVDAEYDSYDEGFTFNTKTLGAYVVSDTKLDTAAVTLTSGESLISANPTTGAAL